jgi:hypothetical protein
MSNTTVTTNPADLRAEADRLDQAAADSFDRCDTDGFLSQWGNGLMAQQRRMEATLAEAGGVAAFPQLTDLDGTPVPAKLVETRFGTKFAVFATAADVTKHHGDVLAWVDPFVRAKTLAKKGLVLVHVLAPARVVMSGGGRGTSGAMNVRPVRVRTDGGFDANAEVVADTDEEA